MPMQCLHNTAGHAGSETTVTSLSKTQDLHNLKWNQGLFSRQTQRLMCQTLTRIKRWTWVTLNGSFGTQSQITAALTAPNTSKQTTGSEGRIVTQLWSGSTDQNNGNTTAHNGRGGKARGKHVQKKRTRNSRCLTPSPRASEQTAPVTLYAPRPTSLAAALIPC